MLPSGAHPGSNVAYVSGRDLDTLPLPSFTGQAAGVSFGCMERCGRRRGVRSPVDEWRTGLGVTLSHTRASAGNLASVATADDRMVGGVQR